MKAKMATTRKLDDEYEVQQLNPAYADTKEGSASHEKIKDLVKKVPEKDSVRMRMAIFEAIADDIIEEKIEENDGQVDVPQIEEEINPVVDKAIALYLVPPTAKKHIARLIATKLKRKDPLIALHAKAAHFLTDSVVKMEEDDCIVSEVLDDKPADTGFDIKEETVEPSGTSPTTAKWNRLFRANRMCDQADIDSGKILDKPLKSDGYDIEEETPVRKGTSPTTQRWSNKWRFEDTEDTETAQPEDTSVQPEDTTSEDLKNTIDETDAKVEDVVESEASSGDVQVDAELPAPAEAAVRFLAASAVNHRKATALVSRKISGVMLVETLFQLRNCLPEKYKRKYGIR